MREEPLADARHATVARILDSVDAPALMLGIEYEEWLETLNDEETTRDE